ncbi:hypothetical protein ACVWZK_000207 [Bradyrhizobium sp. GM0.4]
MRSRYGTSYSSGYGFATLDEGCSNPFEATLASIPDSFDLAEIYSAEFLEKAQLAGVDVANAKSNIDRKIKSRLR